MSRAGYGLDVERRGAVTWVGIAAAAWGLAGTAAILARAVWRLAPFAAQVLAERELTALQWLFAGAWICFMGLFEGYRIFQRGFAPRVVARACHLARQPRLLDATLAPAFCMGLLRASRRRLVTSWTVLAGVVALVLGVRRLAQPYRGIVDAGVVVALAWGVVALAVLAGRAAAGHPPRVPADLPPEGAPQ
jgi:hypothetical protein